MTLHMRYIWHHEKLGTKNHLNWLRDLREQAFDRLTEHYFVPLPTDKDIITVEESNWKSLQHIGLNYQQNKSLTIDETTDMPQFYVSLAREPTQVFSRNDGNVKGVKSNNKSIK